MQTTTDDTNNTMVDDEKDSISIVDRKLLEILSNDIRMDGYISLVKELPTYHHHYYFYNNNKNKKKVIEKLLKRASQKKLLSFLESYSEIFRVSDRNSLPHTVTLVSTKYCNNNNNNSSDDENDDENDVITTRKKLQICSNRKLLEDRIVRVLKKESRKNKRRERTTKISGYSTSWVLKQCKTQLHYYLRSIHFYENFFDNNSDQNHSNIVVVAAPILGSKDWYDFVLCIFIDIITTYMSRVCDFYGDNKDRIYLLHDDEDDINNMNNNNTKMESYVDQVANVISDTLKKDGGTHISLSLLLHRYPYLQNSIPSRYEDILQMSIDNKEKFQNLDIFLKEEDNNNNQLYFRLNKGYEQEGTTTTTATSPKGRMLVDETGLFSIASSKWGNAFVNFMCRHCERILRKRPEETIALDFTASVGGITLPLAKAGFAKVIAIEIDEHRTALCKINMQNHNRMNNNNVDIRNDDSIDSIPKLAKEIIPEETTTREGGEGGGVVIIIDPPWGGMHYKSENKKNNENTMMGKWTLVAALERISQYLSPAIVGIRLPINFDVITFHNELRENNIPFESAQVKKAGPQLFVILALL